MPRQSQRKMDEPKKTSIPAPDPDAIPPQIRSKDPNRSEDRNTDEPRLVGPAPFDSDEVAVKERDGMDYTIKITADMAEQGSAPRKVRVYADGIYDLFHPGHARQLMQAKNVFPKSDVYLLVGVCSDALTRSNKGKTVMNEDDRYDSVRHCRYVDEVVRDAPWTLDDEFLSKHKIDFVAHDEIPYSTGNSTDIYAPLKAKGMFVATQRTEGVSTSDIVANIVKDYDSYIRRNLARGYSRKDLNVSFLRGQKLMLQNKVDTVKKETKDFIERKKDEYLHKWEETSKEVISAFLKYFGSPIDEFWNRGKRRITQVLSPQSSPPASPEYRHEEDSHEDDDDDDEDGPTPAKRVKVEDIVVSEEISVAGTSDSSSSRTSPRKGKKRT